MISVVLRVMFSIVLIAVTLMTGTASHGSPLENENPNIAGKWKTLSLTQNRIGYELTLRKASAEMGRSVYQGTLQFRHRDGRQTKPIKVRLAVGAQSKGGYRVTLVTRGGALASGNQAVSGRLFTSDRSMYFPKCSKAWPLAMKGEEDTDCLFREMPNKSSR